MGGRLAWIGNLVAMQSDPLDLTFDIRFFQFSGQAVLAPWTHRELFEHGGLSKYREFLSHQPELVILGLKKTIWQFPTWQRRAKVGRPAADERTILFALFLRQFMGTTFDDIESWLRLLAPAIQLPETIDESTFRKANANPRFTHLLGRLHAWIHEQLPKRKAVVATDATGYSTKKRVWRGTKHEHRAARHWIKDHNTIEIPTMLYLSGIQTEGRVHDSKVFPKLWNRLPENIEPIRSLADKAYAGQACAHAAATHGATPIHHVKSNAKWTQFPATEYQKMVRFQQQFPQRSRQLRARRSLIETTYSCTKERFGDRIRCRNPIAKANEITTKKIGHNIRILVQRHHVTAS